MGIAKWKKYLIVIAIQLVLVIAFAVCSFFAFKLENVVLEPLKYMLTLGLVLLCEDIAFVFVIFRDIFKKADKKEAHDE